MTTRSPARTLLLPAAALAILPALLLAAAACGGTEEPAPSPTSASPASGSPASQPAEAMPGPTATPLPTEPPTLAPGPWPDAPEFTGIVKWLNTPPLTMEELRGRVVLIDFWTYTCINCLRTLPYIRDWNSKYASRGLVIVGVHSPEFEFEKREDGVREAIVRESVAWPVAMDNNFRTWRAYNNRYWPHKFLIDHHGRIIYDHIGEGAYDETERMIQGALARAGYDISGIDIGGTIETRGPRTRTTRELYAGLGWAGGEYLGNQLPPGDREGLYQDDGSRQEGQFSLHGAWYFDTESVRHGRSTQDLEDYVALKYKAASVNAVIRPDDGPPFPVFAVLDGGPIPEGMRGDDILLDDAGRTYFEAQDARMYNVVRGPKVATHELKLHVDSDQFVLYTFTFGDR